MSLLQNGHRRKTKSEDHHSLVFKVMLVGDSGVGKTCLLVRFKDGTFLSGNFISTVGIDYRSKILDVEGSSVKLQIWDTAGQERFRSITHAYYRDAQALFLVYDVSKLHTFENVRSWLSDIHLYSPDNVLIMLIGNKADSDNDREVSTQTGQQLATENKIYFMETSAKSGLNVDLAFHAIASKLRHRFHDTCDDHDLFDVNDFIEKGRSPKESSTSKCCLAS